MDMATHLQAIYNTLDEIEVRGHANVKRLSLCMDYLKELGVNTSSLKSSFVPKDGSIFI